MPLREFLPIGAMNQWQVRKIRQHPTHVSEDGNLPGCIPNMIGATNHLSNTHVMVVHHDSQEVRGCSICSQNDEVVHIFIGNLDLAHHTVLPSGTAFLRRLDAHHWLAPSWWWCIRWHVAPCPRIAESHALLFRLFSHSIQLFLGTVALVGPTIRQELCGHLLMSSYVFPLANDLAIVRGSHPCHPLQNGIHRGLIVPFRVGVFNTHEELAPMMFGKQVVEKRCAGSADVQISRG
mmetsp:Transcript_56065/g.88905  ORF Transcript_56065/g.88905 Transcript_56065/m.88905 type:complete len:235 (-) Transcript_56065:176-880(-)